MKKFENRLVSLCYEYRTSEGNAYQEASIHISYGRDKNWNCDKSVLWADLITEKGFQCELNAEIPLNALPARWAKRIMRDLDKNGHMYYGIY